MAKRRQKLNTQPLWRFLLIVYGAVMLVLLFGRAPDLSPDMTYRQILRSNLNIVPFYTIDNYMNVVLHYPNAPIFRHCLVNLVGNVVMFIPAGFLLPAVFKAMRKFLLFVLSCFLMITVVESVQLFSLLGFFDVDDIILNLIGMVIGFIVYRCFHRK